MVCIEKWLMECMQFVLRAEIKNTQCANSPLCPCAVIKFQAYFHKYWNSHGLYPPPISLCVGCLCKRFFFRLPVEMILLLFCLSFDVSLSVSFFLSVSLLLHFIWPSSLIRPGFASPQWPHKECRAERKEERRRERESHRGVEVRGKIIIGMTFSSNKKKDTRPLL